MSLVWLMRTYRRLVTNWNCFYCITHFISKIEWTKSNTSLKFSLSLCTLDMSNSINAENLYACLCTLRRTHVHVSSRGYISVVSVCRQGEKAATNTAKNNKHRKYFQSNEIFAHCIQFNFFDSTKNMHQLVNSHATAKCVVA